MRMILRNIAVAGLAATLGTWAAAQTPSATAQNKAAQSSNIQLMGTPKVEYVDDNSAQIAWSTNAKSSATVHYGTSPSALSQTAQAPWGGESTSSSTVHRVKIQGLQPNTTYYYQVDSAQAQGTGTEAKGQVMSFQTQTKDAAVGAWRDGGAHCARSSQPAGLDRRGGAGGRRGAAVGQPGHE